ncbi:MAG: DUF692 domain-containing protein [Gammaproteobacteria bacterium]
MSIFSNEQGRITQIHDVGLGLRSCHYEYIFNHLPAIPWFEIISENYLMEGGPELQRLMQIRQHYPVVMHGVGLSIGSTDPLNQQHLAHLKRLQQRIDPAWISDHLCWTSVNGQYTHDLLPLPYTEEAINHVVQRIQQIQDYLGQRILIENVSSYITYTMSELSEWEFLITIAEHADCYLLLDVNNIYVSAHNHGFDPIIYLNAIPAKRVKQIHLAGYTDQGTHLLDTHGAAIHPPVWELYQQAIQHLGRVPTLIERDNDIPEFSVLWQEAQRAQDILETYSQ